MEDREAVDATSERPESSERKAEDFGEDFESPETPTRLMAESAGEVSELEAAGLQAAESVAGKLGLAVDTAAKEELAEIAAEARAAQGELAAVIEGKEKQESVRETHEYRDAEGNFLGRAILDFAPEERVKSQFASVDGTPGVCRRLLSFKMEGERDGRKTETDLLALAATGDTEVWVGTKRLKNYHSTASEKMVTSPPLETPFDVAVLLHELGHAEQSREERFKKLDPMYTAEARPTMEAPREISKTLEAVRVHFPEAGPYIDQVDTSALEKINERADAKAVEQFDLERAARDLEGEKDDIVRETVTKAFGKNGDIEAFIEKLYASSKEDRPEVLAKAGFEFSDEPLEAEKEGRRSLGRKAVETPKPLPRAAANDYEKARGLLSGIQRISMEEKRTYDPASGKMVVEFPTSVNGRTYTARVSLDVPPDEHQAMIARLEAKEAEAAIPRAKAAEADAERAAILLEYEEKLKEMQVPQLLNLPRNTLERDATRRAFQRMRTLRLDGGVDLFAPGKDPAAAAFVSGEEGCGQAVAAELVGNDGAEEPMTNVQASLRKALGSYGAAKFRLKRSDDSGVIGVMPKPGSDRK